MKSFFITCFLLACPLIIFSQGTDWSRMHALKNPDGTVSIEVSGYDISIFNIKKPSIEESVKLAKQKLGIKDTTADYKDDDIKVKNRILESQMDVKTKSGMSVMFTQACYLLKVTDEDITVIFMKTSNRRNILLEKDLVKEYLAGNLNEHISSSQTTTFMDFAGRMVGFGSVCEWKAPHRVKGKGGEISWSEFSTFDDAMSDINNRILLGNKEGRTVLSEKEIDVIFEGIPSLAYRIVYKENTGSILIAYYIAQEIRGRYVSCILSHYGYGVNDYEIAPLLKPLMEITPQQEGEQVFIPEANQSYSNSWDEEDEKEYFPPKWEIRAGAWIPLWDLSKSFKTAPSIGVSVGLPLGKKTAFDIGFNLAFPTSRRDFEFHYDRMTYDVKADLLANLAFRFRYEQTIAPNVYFTNYIGVGAISLSTDLEKGEWEDENGGTHTEWHSVETIDLFAGASIRYKKVGCFIEYHFNPYSIGGKVWSSFGNSAINTGLFVAF